MSASKTLWFNQLKALTERRRALLEMYEPRLPWAPWAKEAFERQLTRITDEEAALWGMYDDLEVLVRNSVGAPRTVYHRADWPCGHALLRGFPARVGRSSPRQAPHALRPLSLAAPTRTSG